jgi:hypothetical protein
MFYLTEKRKELLLQTSNRLKKEKEKPNYSQFNNLFYQFLIAHFSQTSRHPSPPVTAVPINDHLLALRKSQVF